jgi:glucose 1-dehydrogenase
MIYEDLKGKRVLVTGSSSGIGQATAIMFAQQGCFVGVHYFQTKAGGEKTLEEVKKYSDGILLRADVRDEKQVNKMVEQFAKAAGGNIQYTEDDGGHGGWNKTLADMAIMDWLFAQKRGAATQAPMRPPGR